MATGNGIINNMTYVGKLINEFINNILCGRTGKSLGQQNDRLV